MNINLHTWYATRELDFLPTHFIKCNTGLSHEAKFWVLENLRGRFFIENSNLFFEDETIYFEDPQEAVHYELKWS